MDRLFLVGGRIVIVEQGQVGGDAVGEAKQVEVPIEPPARVLLAEQDHQDEGQEEQADAARHGRGVVVGSAN